MKLRLDILGIVFVAAGAFPALLSALAIFGYFADPDGHVFGTEIGGYIYSTSYHYTSINAIVLSLFVVAALVKHWVVRISMIVLQIFVFFVTVID